MTKDDGVTVPTTEFGPDGKTTVLPLEDWLWILRNDQRPLIRDLLAWEVEMTGPAPRRRRTVTGKPRRSNRETT